MSRRLGGLFTTDFALSALWRLRRAVHADSRCIVIAAMPKSGSTFLSNALTAVTGYQHGYAAFDYANIEQELYRPRLIDIYGAGVVVQQHLRANLPNLKLLGSFGLRPVVQIRNVYDAIISLRDHMYQESLGNLPGLYPSSRFRELAPDRQLDYLVDFAAPWYLSFYYSWLEAEASGKVDLLWVVYEEATADWAGALQRVLDFHRIRVPAETVRQVIDGMKHRPRLETRMNVGVAGRGLTVLTAEQRARVETYASYYPGTDFTRIGVAVPGAQPPGDSSTSTQSP